MGKRSLAGCSLWSCKELDMTEATKHACMHASHIDPESAFTKLNYMDTELT